MADLHPITYPQHLNDHTLTEQELVNLTPAQQALAKDWNVINRKMDWVINEMVTMHNVLVEHDRLLDLWRKLIWLFGILGGIAAFVYTVMRISGKG